MQHNRCDNAERPKSLIITGSAANMFQGLSPGSKTNPSSPSKEYFTYIPEIEEIRISSVISKRGCLHICDGRRSVWKKRWVVSFSIYQSSTENIASCFVESASTEFFMKWIDRKETIRISLPR